MTLKAYTKEERLNDLRRELAKDGLLAAVDKRLDIITDETRSLSYGTWSYVIELAVEIMELMRIWGVPEKMEAKDDD
jgi:hypothetical protein